MSKISVVTPIGKTEWFSLSKIDKFGNYTCTLILEDAPETHQLISKIDSCGEGAKPYSKESDGTFKLKLKLKSNGQKKTGEFYKINPPAIYNALGKRLEGKALEELNVGNGSEIRAKIDLSAYEFQGKQGVSCKVKSVQIAKVVEFNSSDSGFGALESEEIDEGEGKEPDSNYDF